MGQSSGWLMSRNSITPFCALTATSECVHAFLPSVAAGAARAVVRRGHEQVQVLVAALAMLDGVHYAPQPAGAFTTWRARSARLFIVEVRQAQQRGHHAARVVHEDHRTGAEHRSRLGD